MNESRSRAERAFERHLSRGKYPDGQVVREEHRTGFIRAWNMVHRKLGDIKRQAREKRQKAIDRAAAAAETVHND
jgi:uncharacterized membrane protein